MEPDPAALTERLVALAGEAGPYRGLEHTLVRRVRRRRLARAGTVLGATVAATAVTVGVVYSLHGPARTAEADGPQRLGLGGAPMIQTQHCGAVRPTTRLAGAALSDAQDSLGTDVQKVRDLAAGGAQNGKGAKVAGAFADSFTAVATEPQYRTLVVYRVRDAGFDRAICAAVTDVTVQITDSRQSAAKQRVMAGQIGRLLAAAKVPVNQISDRVDGTVGVGTTDPETAQRVLAGYGTWVAVYRNAPGRLLPPLH